VTPILSLRGSAPSAEFIPSPSTALRINSVEGLPGPAPSATLLGPGGTPGHPSGTRQSHQDPGKNIRDKRPLGLGCGGPGQTPGQAGRWAGKPARALGGLRFVRARRSRPDPPRHPARHPGQGGPSPGPDRTASHLNPRGRHPGRVCRPAGSGTRAVHQKGSRQDQGRARAIEGLQPGTGTAALTAGNLIHFTPSRPGPRSAHATLRRARPLGPRLHDFEVAHDARLPENSGGSGTIRLDPAAKVNAITSSQNSDPCHLEGSSSVSTLGREPVAGCGDRAASPPCASSRSRGDPWSRTRATRTAAVR